MSKRFPGIEQARLTLDESTRRRHLDAINTEILRVTEPKSRKLRFLAVGIALVLLLPVIALASEGSVPGDFLYPVKRVVEPIATVFDADVVGERRVEEVETLLDRAVPTDVIHHYVDEARRAVTDHRSELSDRIDAVVAELDRRENLVDEGTGDPVEEVAKTDDGSQFDSGAATDRHSTTTTVERTTSTEGHDRRRDG